MIGKLMVMINYSSLHCHSSYSFLDGIGLPRQIAERVKELGQKYCAITDHGVITGHAEFWTEMTKASLIPLLGSEMYHVSKLRQATKRGSRTKEETESHEIAHITILARDQVGYRNLLKLSSLSYEKGFYKKPSINTASLVEHQEGLIILSGCVIGHVSRLINANKLDQAREWLAYFKRNIEHFYVEICPCHTLEISKIACTHLWQMADELSIPRVITDDAHFPRPGDYLAQDTLLCANTRTRWKPFREFQLPPYHYHCSGEEILDRARKTLPEIPEADLIAAIEQSVTIAEGCSAELPKSAGPIFQVPEGITAEDLLRKLAKDGLKKKLEEIELCEKTHSEISSEKSLSTQKPGVGYGLERLIQRDTVSFDTKENNTRSTVSSTQDSEALSEIKHLITSVEIENAATLPILIQSLIESTPCEEMARAQEILERRIVREDIHFTETTSLSTQREDGFAEPVIENTAENTCASTIKNIEKDILKEKHNQIFTDRSYWERLNHELDIICTKGIQSYILIVWDLVRELRSRGIFIIPRGSAGGSLVLWSLDITKIDPIEFGLSFERFFDETRDEWPDIDLDVSSNRREEAFKYLEDKYGKDCTAHIAALSSFGARQALNDVAFVHQVPDNALAAIIALVPEVEDANEGLHDAQVLRRLYLTNETARTLFKRHKELLLAIKLEGQFRTSSIHAAGFLIDSKPLTETVGICSRPGKDRCAALNKDYAAAQGLLKIDVLSSSTMTGIVTCLRSIGRDTEWLYGLPLDDPDTYVILSKGLNQGIFQLQGSAAGRIMKDLKPETFHEIAALGALARPGPMQSGSVKRFVRRKHGMEASPTLHPIFGSILDKTFGVIIYQEQVMRVAREAGGLEWVKVHKIRKLISKSGGANAVKEYEEEYLRGCRERQIPLDQARSVWEQCLAAGNYLFNMSHSYAYALVGYWTAYLKCHYPSEFTAAMACCFHGQSADDKRRQLFRDFQAMGGKTRLLDYEQSQDSFLALDNSTVLGGFGDLKGWGPEAVRIALESRARRPFASWQDFYGRTSRSLGDLIRLTGVHTGQLDTDVVLSLAPWYPEVHLNEIERQVQREQRCLPICHLSKALERPDVFYVPIVGRVTALRVVDLVAQAKKYGGQPPAAGQPRYRAVVTVTDHTGTVDIGFSAEKWEQITSRTRIHMLPEEGRGSSVLVDLTFSTDRTRIYGEDLRIFRHWKRHEVTTSPTGNKMTMRQREEIGGQLAMAFEQIKSQELFTPIR